MINIDSKNSIEIIELTTLLTILNTPDFQRVIDDDHTTKIYNSLLDELKNTGSVFSNTVHISFDSERTLRSKGLIIDGQHRLCAFKRLYDTTGYNTKIVVWIHIVDRYSQNYELFNKLNSHKPITLYEAENDQIAITRLTQWFKKEYGKFIKTSENPIGFNFNMEKIISEFRSLKSIGSAQYISAFKSLNSQILEIPDSEMTWLSASVLTLYIKLKTSSEPFPAFAMIKNVKKLAQVVKYILEGKNVNLIELFNDSCKIPKQIRMKVWNKYNGDNMRGVCYCCKESLLYENAHISHVVARALGGSSDVFNLRPCCLSCNLSMGVENLEDFKLKCEKINKECGDLSNHTIFHHDQNQLSYNKTCNQ